ncbi:hypothetical protein SDJN03_26309, partial [Cucurbita argyrosperma subsp. sororia]
MSTKPGRTHRIDPNCHQFVTKPFEMAFFSSHMFRCCFPPSRVSAAGKEIPSKNLKSEKKPASPERKGAPIVVSYFPVNSYPSRM